MSATDNIRVFEFFRIGEQVALSGKAFRFDEGDLNRIARNYLFQTPVPLIISNPLSIGPSYGTVREIFVKGGSLYAVATCGKALVGLAHKGAFSNRFVCFTNKGDFRLCRIGFVKSETPAEANQQSDEFKDGPYAVFLADPDVLNTDLKESFFGLALPAKSKAGRNTQPPASLIACQICAGCLLLSFDEALSIAKRHLSRIDKPNQEPF